MTPATLHAEDVLPVVYGDADGVLNLRAIALDPSVPPVQTFVAPSDPAAIVRFCHAHADSELYFGVALRRDATSGTLANCTTLPALFVDVDFKSYPGGECEARAALARCPLLPTAIVHSGGGLHAYWMLAEPFTLPAEAPEAKDLLRRLAVCVGGDLAAAEPARVLRMPGTANHKYAPARPVKIESLGATRVYQPSDFDDWLPSMPRETQATVAAPVQDVIAEGARNATLTSLAGSMRRRGMTANAIEAALMAENAARCRPPLPEPEVAAIVRSVGRYDPEGEPPTDAATADPTAQRLAEAIVTERIRREARRHLDAEERGEVRLPEFLTLRDWLAQPDEPVRWRIAGWQPKNSRVILTAQFKAGKTTVRDNYVRSLVDGDPWLGVAAVTPVTGRVAIFDVEMSRRQMKAWLRDQNIRDTDRVIPVPLRGQAAAFNILNPDTRRQWADWLRARDTEVLILDCLRPVLDALGLDEHHDAGRFLVAFDALLAEAGIADALLIHHMGHTGERARGDSRLRDWPDAEWRLVRQDENPASPRFISAFGRDVDVAESQLHFYRDTRRLTLAGGSRHDAKAQGALGAVLALLDRTPEPMSGRAIEEAFEGADPPRDAVRAALKLGVSTGAIGTRPGGNRAILHFRPSIHEGVRECAEVRGECAAHTASECAAALIEPRTRAHASGLTSPDSARAHRFDPARAFGPPDPEALAAPDALILEGDE